MRSASIDQQPAAARAAEPFDWALWREWLLTVSAGEFLGFTAPAIVGAVAYAAGARDAALLPPLVAAGAVEGAALGFAQSRVLRRRLPELSARDWIARTSAAAAFAWAIGMTPSALGTWAERHTGAMIAGSVVLGPVLLSSIGAAQWSVLRPHMPRAWRWIVANDAAWLAGMSFVFAAMAALPEDAPPWASGVAAASGGLCMGVTAAAITGAAIVRMLLAGPSRRVARAG